MLKTSSVKIMLAAMLMVPVVGTAMVSAEDSGSNSGSSTKTTTTKTEDSVSTSGTDSARDKAELTKRLQERKDKVKTILTAAEKVKIQSKCKNSQGKFSSLNGRIQGIGTTRGKVNTDLVSRLEDLSEKLKAKNLDTTTLNTQITELKAKVATYDKDLATYKQTVADLGTMDCATDPTAFKASLETARQQLATVKQDAVNIRTYVNSTIKVTLQQLRDQLKKTESESTEDN